jgi:hypothetical protein
MTQSQAYKWLRKKLRLTRDECHIGRFGVEQCEEVIRVSQDFLIQIQLGKVDAKRHYNNIANYVRESYRGHTFHKYKGRMQERYEDEA